MPIRLVLAAVLLLAGLAPAGAQTPLRASDLVREFEDVAFTEGFDPASATRRDGRLFRPVQPMDFHVSAIGGRTPATAEMKAVLGELAATLKQRAGVTIRIKASGGQPFGVVALEERMFGGMAAIMGQSDTSYLTSFAFAQGIKKEGCFFTSSADEEGRILGGRVMVDVGSPEPRRRSCILRGVVFFLGLTGETRAPSGVFGGGPDVRGFTERDLAIVRMAFDPRLKPWMTLAEARPLLPAIAADALAR